MAGRQGADARRAGSADRHALSINDPQHVREQYRTETGLAARSSLYDDITGPFAGDVALEALAEVSPSRVLEVGCGPGWFAARAREELGAEVVAVDTSERMVELARARGVDARVGDVQELPFEDRAFDAAAANWMLYHVPDVDRAVAELARVLRPGGRLVAITNSVDHLLELWELVGATEARRARWYPFGAENGRAILERHFDDVEMRDASGRVTIHDRDAIVRYIASTQSWHDLVERLPADVPLPLVARRLNVVFVADRTP